MRNIPIDRSVPVSCDRDCGAGCPLQAHVAGGRVVRITDNPLAPELMRGCIKGYRMADTVYAADRLRSPLIRTGERGSGRFREVGWPEALDYVAGRLREIRERHGPLAFLPFNGSGSCRAAVHNTSLVGRRFFAMLGGFVNRTDSYSSAASAFIDRRLFGTRDTGLDPLSLERSRMILLWGANVCETRFSSRIEIRCDALAATEASAVPRCRVASPDPAHPLRMITPHSKFRVNSQNANLPWARRLVEQALVMNPRDAAARGIHAGDTVRVRSFEGEMRIAVALTEDIVAGCVALTQGAWTAHDAQGVEMGGSANTLTSTTPTLPSHGSRTHSVFVEVTHAIGSNG